MQARGGGAEPAAHQGEGGPGQQPHRARGGARGGASGYLLSDILMLVVVQVMRRYKASVAAVTTDQITIQDQSLTIQSLECERNKLREQYAELCQRLVNTPALAILASLCCGFYSTFSDFLNAFFVKFFALGHWVKYPKIGCSICTTSCNPLPTSSIISNICVK